MLKARREVMLFEEAKRLHEGTILRQVRRMPHYHNYNDRGQRLIRELHARKN